MRGEAWAGEASEGGEAEEEEVLGLCRERHDHCIQRGGDVEEGDGKEPYEAEAFTT